MSSQASPVMPRFQTGGYERYGGWRDARDARRLTQRFGHGLGEPLDHLA